MRSFRSIGLFVLAVGTAHATPTAERVVLADGDAELGRAVETSLRPWHFVVIVDTSAPVDANAAETRAVSEGARFVVWRDGDELVVYDQQTGVSEHRPARWGVFDPTSAAAAALSVKTMMRLPPPLDAAHDAPAGVIAAVAPAAPNVELQLDAGAGVRYADGLAALRFGVRVTARPWQTRGWWFGAIGDFGAPAAIQGASFKGTWTDWAVLAAASYTFVRTPWSLEPWAAAGIERSALDGTEQNAAFDEGATLLALRGGAILRYRVGWWSIAAGVTAADLPHTETYTMTHSSAPIFEIPPFGVTGALLLGGDLPL